MKRIKLLVICIIFLLIYCTSCKGRHRLYNSPGFRTVQLELVNGSVIIYSDCNIYFYETTSGKQYTEIDCEAKDVAHINAIYERKAIQKMTLWLDIKKETT